MASVARGPLCEPPLVLVHCVRRNSILFQSGFTNWCPMMAILRAFGLR